MGGDNDGTTDRSTERPPHHDDGDEYSTLPLHRKLQVNNSVSDTYLNTRTYTLPHTYTMPQSLYHEENPPYITVLSKFIVMLGQ